MDTKITQIEDLITRYKQLKAHLSNFEPKNTEHRQLVIKAIEIYIKKYIPPALHLIATDEEGNKLISINQVVGEQITGLGLNLLFDSKRQDLTRPSNEELNEVLEYAGREPTPQLRDDFWTAWLLRESKSCLKALINFLATN